MYVFVSMPVCLCMCVWAGVGRRSLGLGRRRIGRTNPNCERARAKFLSCCPVHTPTGLTPPLQTSLGVDLDEGTTALCCMEVNAADVPASPCPKWG